MSFFYKLAPTNAQGDEELHSKITSPEIIHPTLRTLSGDEIKSDEIPHTSKLDILDLMVQDLTSIEEDDKQLKFLDQLLKSISDAS